MKNGKPNGKSALGGSFTFPGTSMTVRRAGYVAMQLAGRRDRGYEGVLVAMSYSISILIIRNLHVFGFSCL